MKQTLKETLQEKLNYLMKKDQQHKTSFSEGPAFFLSSYTEEVFFTHSLIGIIVQTIKALDKDVTKESLCDQFLYEIIKAGKWPCRSTSPIANLKAEAQTKAYVEIYEFLKKTKEAA